MNADGIIYAGLLQSGCQHCYFTGLFDQKGGGAYVRLAADYYKPTEGDDKRVITRLGVGLTF